MISRLIVAAGLALALLFLAAAGISVAAGLMFREASLSSDGMAYEVNTDASGNLFISDYAAGEIWQVLPATGAYTQYLDLPHPSDARPDRMGDIWWTDWDVTLGQVHVLTETVTTWVIEPDQLPQTLGGLAIDEAGRVWITTHSFYSTRIALYRFDPKKSELCAYGWDGGSASYYVLYHAGQVWLGDDYRRRIIRFDPTAAQDQVSWWSLASDASPRGLAMDAADHLWWSDPGANALGSLDPDYDLVTTYDLPSGSSPEMLTFDGGRAWYTTISGSVGAVDPALAGDIGAPVATGSLTMDTVSCRRMETGTTTAVSSAQDVLKWGTPAELAPILDDGGWTIYQLPSGAEPRGIARTSVSLWLADNGRQKLVRLDDATSLRTFLPLIIR
jgi:streptogramin lyase